MLTMLLLLQLKASAASSGAPGIALRTQYAEILPAIMASCSYPARQMHLQLLYDHLPALAVVQVLPQNSVIQPFVWVMLQALTPTPSAWAPGLGVLAPPCNPFN